MMVRPLRLSVPLFFSVSGEYRLFNYRIVVTDTQFHYFSTL
jgi:hypothetical protein